MNDALRSARRARDAAKLSGHEKTRRSAILNIGYFSLCAGELDQANTALSEVSNGFAKGSNQWFTVVNARVVQALSAGDLEGCEKYISVGEAELRLGGQPVTSPPQIDLRLARARLIASRGAVDEARETLREAALYADQRGDYRLRAECALEAAMLAALGGERRLADLAVDDFLRLTELDDVGRRGDLHWLRAHLAHVDGDFSAASLEYARALRIWGELGGHNPSRRPVPMLAPGHASTATSTVDTTAIATLTGLGARPRLLGREAAAVIEASGGAARIRVVAGPPGSRRALHDSKQPGEVCAKAPSHCVDLESNTACLISYRSTPPKSPVP